MKKIKDLISMAILAGLAGLSFSSCSTTQGFGKDLQRLGEKIEDKSQDGGKEETYDY